MLKPIELKKKTFSKSIKGYSVPEVDEYMSFVIEKYTEVYKKNFELEQQLRAAMELKGQLEGEKESVRGALINAQKVAAKIIETANERAEAIIDSAKEGCNAILSDFDDQINAERETIMGLKKEVAALKKELFEKYREHIETVEQLTKVTDSITLKTNEEYLNDAVAKTQKELKLRKNADKPDIKINLDITSTHEIPKVKIDPDELLEDADTVVFERISAHTKAEENTSEDAGDTIVIDKITE